MKIFKFVNMLRFYRKLSIASYKYCRFNLNGEKKMAMKRIALFLGLLGGINWGLVGSFKFDLIKFAFDFMPVLVPVVQIIIGIAACIALFVYMVK